MATDQLTAMREGGRRLGQIKRQLHAFTTVGTTFEAIEAEAQRLIAEHGAKPSFSTVPGYSWATCVMKNAALCHGIPQAQMVEDGDSITIDVGLLWEGYHLDTTISFGVGELESDVRQFLEDGQTILNKAIAKVKDGVSVYDISSVFEKELLKRGYGAVYQLTGHGIGKKLHDNPAIPCVAVKADKQVFLSSGQTVAIEIMYTMGDAELEVAHDGWTYQTKDGSLSAMFEETVAVTKKGAEVLTR